VQYNKDKVDEMVLALLYLTSSHDQYGTRAWKGLDVGIMDRLCEKGYLVDPRGKSPTVLLTETGEKLSKNLFFKYFDAKE
jgi:Domain of unknown function (DUF6429)